MTCGAVWLKPDLHLSIRWRGCLINQPKGFAGKKDAYSKLYIPVLTLSDKIVSCSQLEGHMSAWVIAPAKTPGTLPGTRQSSGNTPGLPDEWHRPLEGWRAQRQGVVGTGCQRPPSLIFVPVTSLRFTSCYEEWEQRQTH